MAQLPKLKAPGLITAWPSDGPADAQLAAFKVEWHDGITFRQVKYADVHSAVCITPEGKDFMVAGLHLTPDAAVHLAHDIWVLPATTCMTLKNHSGGVEQPWRTFSFTDARALSQMLNDIGLLHL